MGDTVTIEGVEYVGAAPSGLAFFVLVGTRRYSVPCSVVHEDSEIFIGCETTIGKLIVPGWFAERANLVPKTRDVGLVFKKPPRSRISPPEMMDAKRLRELKAFAEEWPVATVEGCNLFDSVGGLTGFTGIDEDAATFAEVPTILAELIAEAERYRAFVRRVTR